MLRGCLCYFEAQTCSKLQCTESGQAVCLMEQSQQPMWLHMLEGELHIKSIVQLKSFAYLPHQPPVVSWVSRLTHQVAGLDAKAPLAVLVLEQLAAQRLEVAWWHLFTI